MNNFNEDLAGTPARDLSELQMEGMRLQGGMFVEAVRVTRLPMLVTDATLPGNPIIFANEAFLEMSGYSSQEVLGQEPHFMNGDGTDVAAVENYERAMMDGREDTVELLQYRKDGAPFRSMLYATPLDDGQGVVTNHFLSYLDISRRYEAEKSLRLLTAELEARVAARTSELQAANAALSKLVAEREILVAEVNHRAKNSLAIAASLIGLQALRQDDDDVAAQFIETQDRMIAMARVHDMLSKSEEAIQHVDVSRYIQELCDAHRPVTDGHGRIRIETDLEAGIMVSPDTAVPLGIVLSELITNALKYAFPDTRSGTLLARARRYGDAMVEVVISDDGIGMVNAREGALGYGIVRSLVQQIGGNIDLRNANGLIVTIIFPIALHG